MVAECVCVCVMSILNLPTFAFILHNFSFYRIDHKLYIKEMCEINKWPKRSSFPLGVGRTLGKGVVQALGVGCSW